MESLWRSIILGGQSGQGRRVPSARGLSWRLSAFSSTSKSLTGSNHQAKCRNVLLLNSKYDNNNNHILMRLIRLLSVRRPIARVAVVRAPPTRQSRFRPKGKKEKGKRIVGLASLLALPALDLFAARQCTAHIDLPPTCIVDEGGKKIRKLGRPQW